MQNLNQVVPLQWTVFLACTHTEVDQEFCPMHSSFYSTVRYISCSLDLEKTNDWQSIIIITSLLLPINQSGTVNSMHVCLRMPFGLWHASWLAVTHSTLGLTFAFLNLRFLQTPQKCSDSLSLWHFLVSEQPTRDTCGRIWHSLWWITKLYSWPNIFEY